MKILLINNIGSTHAGAEGMIAELIAGLRAHGDQVALLSGNEYTSDVHLNTYEFKSFHDDSPWRLIGYLYNPFAVRSLRQAIRDFQPDIIHLHNAAKASPWILPAIGNIPAVITVHDHNIFDPTKLNSLPTLKPFAKQLSGYFTNQLSLRYFAEKAKFALLRPWYWQHINVAVACSQFYAQALRESGLFREVATIHNGIGLPNVQPYPIAATRQTILFTGRLEAIKGPQTLIAAFSQIATEYPNVQLVIAGGGPDSAQLKRQAAKLELANERISFTGYLERQQVLGMYANAHVVVIPSEYPDNLPTTCIEAMAAGRPVIASQIGGLPEMVKPGRTGYLTQPGDAAELANALRRILRDPAHAQSLGQAARQFAEQEFSSEHYLAATRQLYKRLTRASQTGSAAKR